MKASASATASSATPSAAACCCIWSTAPARMPAQAYRIVRGELEAYGHGLTDKPEIVALTKADALTPEADRAANCKTKEGHQERRRW